MEAMASGLPCVVSDIRGNIDLIDENGGAFFNPHSVEECKNAFLQVMDCNFAELGAYNINKVKGFDTEIVKDHIKVAYRIQ